MGGTNLASPTFAVGDTYCAVGNKLMVGSYGYPTGNITFYCSGYSHFLNYVQCDGQITASAMIINNAASVGNGLTITNGGCNITGGLVCANNIVLPSGNLTVSTGSTIAQDITCTTLTASGTVSGTGITNLLSPYALTSSLSNYATTAYLSSNYALATSITNYISSSPIIFSLITTISPN